MKYLIPLFFPFILNAQSFEIRNESSTCAKVIADFGEQVEPGKEYTIRLQVSENVSVKFMYMSGNKLLRMIDFTDCIKKGIKWKAKKEEDLIILIHDQIKV